MIFKNNKHNASALLLTLVVLSSLMVIALGSASLLIDQLKRSGNMMNSVKAYQAADTGMEYALYQMFSANPPNSGNINDFMCNDEDSWNTDFLSDSKSEFCRTKEQGTQGNVQYVTIKSIGRSGKVRRAIQITLTKKPNPTQ